MLDRSTARAFAGALAFTSALAINISCGGDDTKPVSTTPTIVTFSANPSMVPEGGRTTLTYEVTDATSVKIDIENGDNVLPETSMLMGTAETPVLNVSTKFVLTAVNGDKTTTDTVTVFVQPLGHATIISFDADPATVLPGQQPRLRWLTLNAREGAIRQGAVEIYNIADGELSTGEFMAPAITENTSYTLVVRGEDMEDVTNETIVLVGGNAPEIDSFTATPSTINLGEMSTLSWSVRNATEIVVSGPTSGEVYRGANLNGSATVMPAADETFTLVASNGPNTDTGFASVTVTQPIGARILSFLANPSTINLGDTTTLSWQVADAPGGIEIVAGANTATTSLSPTGSIQVSPMATTTYTLYARNPNGDATQAVTVTVVAVGAPVIFYFHAAQELVGRNQTTQLAWRTSGGDELRIYANDVEIYNTVISVDLGTYDATVTDLITNFRLEVSNAAGNNTFTIRVSAHDAPVINSFTANPPSYSGPTPITLSWDVGSANFIALYEGGIGVPGFPIVSTGTVAGASSGTFTITINRATTFLLVARSAGGEARATVEIVGAVNELEPNNTSTTAQPIPPNTGVTSQIGVEGDVDWYSFTVPAGGYVIAYTSDGAGGCPFDTVIYLVAPNGTTQLATNDDDGVTACSRIDARTTPAAANLPAGTYYVWVRAYSGTQTGAYSLTVRSGPPGCGNGVIEGSINEQCDDGNTRNNDGCTSLCRYEVDGTYVAPGSPEVTFSGAISPVGDVDTYLLTVTSTVLVDIESFVPAAPGVECANNDTILRVYNARTGESLYSDDDGGLDYCSLITGISFPPGDYLITIEEYGGNAEITAYSIVFRIAIAAVCGNGNVEAGNSEECDDGNTTAGDGCSALCTIEINPTTISGTGGSVTVDLTSPTAFAVIRVDLATAGQGISAISSDAGAATCNTVDTALDLTNGNFTIRGTKLDDGPTGTAGDCAAIVFPTDTFAINLGSPTYYVIVYSEDGTIGQVQVQITIHNPGCGNGALETAVGESCDDGNTMPGDGCSGTCTLEGPPAINITEVEPNEDFATAQSLGTLGLPTIIDISASFGATPDNDYFSFTIASTANVLINTYGTPGEVLTSCPGDTVIYLYSGPSDANFVTTSDDEGFGVCSIISGSDTSPTREVLTAGTYYIKAEEYSQDDLIPQYYLRVDVQ